MSILNLFLKTYKSGTSLYFPNGEYQQISCFHVNEGSYGVLMTGEVFPVNPVLGSPPIQQPVMVAAGSTFADNPPFISPPTTSYQLCTRLKDPASGIVYYVDAVDYAANIGPVCNPVSAVSSSCYAPNNVRVTVNGGLGIVTLGWTAAGGGVSYELYNSTTDAPGVGTMDTATLGTHLYTGLSLNTAYYFFIRTVCIDSSRSGWVRVAYTTHA